jgi:predicted TIM-barrel fold metal-dependent hydrolase
VGSVRKVLPGLLHTEEATSDMSTDGPAVQYGLIDCHQHIRITEVAAPDGRAMDQDLVDRDLANRRSMMERNHIESSVLMPSFDYNKSEGLRSTELVLDWLRQYQQSALELFPWIICTVEPYFYDQGRKQLEELLSSGVFSGVTWHNRFHGMPSDAPPMFKLVEVAVSHDVPIFFHAGANLDHEEAYKVAKLVRAFPTGKFLVLDSLSMPSSMAVMTDLLLETENVWVDIANALPVYRMIERVGTTAGWDRVVFGSCFYSVAHSNIRCSPLEELLMYDMDPADQRRVLRDNLLGILEGPRDSGPG